MTARSTGGRVRLTLTVVHEVDSFAAPDVRSLVLGAIVAKVGRAVAGKLNPSPDNCVFDSKVLSRTHAEIWAEGTKVLIKDTKSSNGTYVNDGRLSPSGVESEASELRDGDTLKLGVDVVETAASAHKCVVLRVGLSLLPAAMQSSQTLNSDGGVSAADATGRSRTWGAAWDEVPAARNSCAVGGPVPDDRPDPALPSLEALLVDARQVPVAVLSAQGGLAGVTAELERAQERERVHADTLGALQQTLAAAAVVEARRAQQLAGLAASLAAMEAAVDVRGVQQADTDRLVGRLESLERQLEFYMLRHVDRAANPDAAAEVQRSLANAQDDKHAYDSRAKATLRQTILEKEVVLESLAATRQRVGGLTAALDAARAAAVAQQQHMTAIRSEIAAALQAQRASCAAQHDAAASVNLDAAAVDPDAAGRIAASVECIDEDARALVPLPSCRDSHSLNAIHRDGTVHVTDAPDECELLVQLAALQTQIAGLLVESEQSKIREKALTAAVAAAELEQREWALRVQEAGESELTAVRAAHGQELADLNARLAVTQFSLTSLARTHEVEAQAHAEHVAASTAALAALQADKEALVRSVATLQGDNGHMAGVLAGNGAALAATAAQVQAMDTQVVRSCEVTRKADAEIGNTLREAQQLQAVMRLVEEQRDEALTRVAQLSAQNHAAGKHTSWKGGATRRISSLLLGTAIVAVVAMLVARTIC